MSAAAGVTVDPTELTVLEDGGMADYTLVLDTAPTADVTIAVASDTVTAATVSSASLTFTPTDWNTAQTVTVTGVNDDVDNPSDARTASLSHTPTSADAGYGSVVIDPVTVTVEDDDTAGVTVDLMALMVLEASGTSTYTVVLDTQPTGNVTITPESGDTMAATVSGALTFTTTDWNTAQTVTVTGVNDNDDNTGNARTATLTHTSSGADTTYNNLASIDSVTVTVQDDDDPTTGTVTVTLNPGIAGNDEVNIDEQAAGFTISGTVADGGMVEVTLDSGTPRGTTETGTTWTLDIPANDPEITGTSVVVEATAMLAGASGTVTRPLIVDLVRPTATYAPPPTLTVGTAITAITPVSPSADIARYNVQSGTIPPGLTLASDTGIISGTPTTADVATAPVTITLRDGAGNPTNVEIIFPMVAMGSQTLDGFAYGAGTATVGQTAPTVTAPTGAVVGSTLSYSTTSAGICTVNSSTGALTAGWRRRLRHYGNGLGDDQLQRGDRRLHHHGVCGSRRHR